jgi:hypothetical protein
MTQPPGRSLNASHFSLVQPLVILGVLRFALQNEVISHEHTEIRRLALPHFTHAINKDKLAAQYQVMEAMLKPRLLN